MAHEQYETFAKKPLFAPALLHIRTCSFTIEYAAFAAELKNKHAVFARCFGSAWRLAHRA